jgi:hypothetical protein
MKKSSAENRGCSGAYRLLCIDAPLPCLLRTCRPWSLGAGGKAPVPCAELGRAAQAHLGRHPRTVRRLRNLRCYRTQAVGSLRRCRNQLRILDRRSQRRGEADHAATRLRSACGRRSARTPTSLEQRPRRLDENTRQPEERLRPRAVFICVPAFPFGGRQRSSALSNAPRFSELEISTEPTIPAGRTMPEVTA